MGAYMFRFSVTLGLCGVLSLVCFYMTIGIFSSVDLSGNGASTTTPFGKGEKEQIWRCHCHIWKG